MSDAVDLLVLMCVGQCVLVLVLTFLSILCVALISVLGASCEYHDSFFTLTAPERIAIERDI